MEASPRKLESTAVNVSVPDTTGHIQTSRGVSLVCLDTSELFWQNEGDLRDIRKVEILTVFYSNI